MAASLSRPDPSSPASVAEAGFSTTRRGYHQEEVRAFLTSVAAELGRLQERERQLDAELRDLRSATPESVELDDETVTQLLGEETLRVLQTARESASQIKIRAEESAARILREANDEANRLRQEAEVEAARKRQDASSDAEAEVALAKQQGREMVNEARAYRERVLADLERRTKLARQQIEELLHGRDRLLQVFERARLVAVDVTSDLAAVQSPEELVNFSPTTGPLPLMIPASHVDRAQPETEGDVGAEAAETLDSSAIADADAADQLDEVDDQHGEVETADQLDEAEPEPDGGADDVESDDDDAESPVSEDAAESDDDDEPAVSEDAAEPDATRRDANVVSLFRGRAAPEPADASEAEDVAEAPTGEAAGDTERPDVGGLFARLRSEVPSATDDVEPIGGHDGDAAEEADRAAAESTPESTAETVEPTPFSRRDEAIVPLIVAGAKKLKRVLADEQNGVLDTLRQPEPVTALDQLVPDPDTHVGNYTDAIAAELLGAAAAGAVEVGASDTASLRRKLGRASALDSAVGVLRNGLIVPLRDRLERSIGDGAGDNDDLTKRIRAVYREWKTQHIDDQLDDVFRSAYGRGLAVTVDPGTPIVWTIDPSEPACPDCEDNSLAGPIAAGDAYPTGHTAAPAHPGCRCLTVPVAQ